MKLSTLFPELNLVQLKLLEDKINWIIGSEEVPINSDDDETFIENYLKAEQRERLNELIGGENEENNHTI
jgi:hypothetical protein